jgi:hypothetical protein
LWWRREELENALGRHNLRYSGIQGLVGFCPLERKRADAAGLKEFFDDRRRRSAHSKHCVDVAIDESLRVGFRKLPSEGECLDIFDDTVPLQKLAGYVVDDRAVRSCGHAEAGEIGNSAYLEIRSTEEPQRLVGNAAQGYQVTRVRGVTDHVLDIGRCKGHGVFGAGDEPLDIVEPAERHLDFGM